MPSTVTFHPLLCHPSADPLPDLAIAARVELDDAGGLSISYRLRGDLDQLTLPPPETPRPQDGLWQHTCCEAFVAAVDAPGYQEFNFSPSGCWAAYRFADYRWRAASWLPGGEPLIAFRRERTQLQLDARLPAELLPAGETLRLGLSAVLETRAGAKSYWALHHAGPQPDFHLPASFTLALNRP